MGIQIDVDKYLLCGLFNINAKKLSSEYDGMTIEEIMKAEALQGNKAAEKFDAAILSDPVKLIELFELKDPSNKFAILSNMNQEDLDELLPLLKQEDLAMGLNFFEKDKLLQMMEDLPKNELVKMSFQMFSPEQLMEYMPDEEIDKVLCSDDMKKNKGLEMKYLQNFKPEVLAQMYETTTGQPAPTANQGTLDPKPQYDASAIYNQIVSLPDDKFQEAMLNIPKQNKKEFMLQMAKENPKIFLMFDSKAYTNLIGQRKEKPDIIKSAMVLKPESLVKMVSHLPKNLTAIVLTQIETSKFANVLQDKFRNILKQLTAG